MIRLLKRRRERRRFAVIQAQHALVSLPNVRWHDDDSEDDAHDRLQRITATVDRALRRVRSSDDALALKYAHARLAAFLRGWDDAELLPPTDLPEMYQSLVTSLHTLAVRLAAEENGSPAHEPVLACAAAVKPGPDSRFTHLPPVRSARLDHQQTSIPRRSRRSSFPTTNQPGDHE